MMYIGNMRIHTYTDSFSTTLNSIWLGLQTDYMARHWSLGVVDRGFDLEQAFTIFFVADIIVRVACHGLKFFSFVLFERV